MRLELARAMLYNADLLLLDEVSTLSIALDMANDVLLNYCSPQITFVETHSLISHAMLKRVIVGS